jgi:hypothetical protein
MSAIPLSDRSEAAGEVTGTAAITAICTQSQADTAGGVAWATVTSPGTGYTHATATVTGGDGPAALALQIGVPLPDGLRLTVLRPHGGAVLGVMVAAGGAPELITSGGAWRVAAVPPPVIAAGLAATGTSQADALPVLAQVNVVETVLAGAGVLLPA